jgi:hypothetical protein
MGVPSNPATNFVTESLPDDDEGPSTLAFEVHSVLLGRGSDVCGDLAGGNPETSAEFHGRSVCSSVFISTFMYDDCPVRY